MNIIDGKVYINDSDTPLDEPYLPEPIAEGSYGPIRCRRMLFHDGRQPDNSLDARFWKNQFVPKEGYHGKSTVLLLSKNRESGVDDRMNIIISLPRR